MSPLQMERLATVGLYSLQGGGAAGGDGWEAGCIWEWTLWFPIPYHSERLTPTFTLPVSRRRHWNSCSLWNGCNGSFFFFNGQISLLRGGGWGNDWFCLQTVLNLSFFNDLSLTYFSRMARSMKLSIKGWPSQSQLSQASHVTLGKAVKLSCPKVMKGLETDWIPVLNTSQSTHEILKVLVSHL